MCMPSDTPNIHQFQLDPTTHKVLFIPSHIHVATQIHKQVVNQNQKTSGEIKI